jgi:hypothetical protein
MQKMKTPRLLRGVSPLPQSYSRGATPMVINGHEDSGYNTNPASTRAAPSFYQDFNPLTAAPNANPNLLNYSQARMTSQKEVRLRRSDSSSFTSLTSAHANIGLVPWFSEILILHLSFIRTSEYNHSGIEFIVDSSFFLTCCVLLSCTFAGTGTAKTCGCHGSGLTR